MCTVLLSVHVVLAVLTVGPITVAASLFRPTWQKAAADSNHYLITPGDGSPPRELQPTHGPAEPVPKGQSSHGGLDTVRLLHRITRTYAAVGLAVPVLGLATAASLGVLTDPWVLTAIVLVVFAAVLLVARVLPLQRLLLDGLGPGAPSATSETGAASMRLAMATGIFNLLVVVMVLMIWRPGSTTGV